VGVDWSGATKCDYSDSLRCAAALGHMHPNGRSHCLINHIMDSPRGGDGITIGFLGYVAVDCRSGGVQRQRQRTTREIGGVQVAEHQISISYGREISAPPITNRAWFSRRATRTDLYEPKSIDLSNAPAAGADFNKMRAWDRNRISTRLGEALRASNLQLLCDRNLAILNKACFCGRTAHVKGKNVLEIAKIAIMLGHLGTRHGTGLYETNRKFSCRPRRCDPAVGEHDVQRGVNLRRGQSVRQVSEVRFHDRAHVSIHYRSTGAFIFLDLR